MDVLRSEMPVGESRSFIRETFATLLLLRWFDLQDAEKAAIAAFEDRTYEPLLPQSLQWRHWSRLGYPEDIADRLQELAHYVKHFSGDLENWVTSYLHVLADPLHRMLRVNGVYMIDLVRWVDELPFETPSERHSLLDMFDQVMAETNDGYQGQFSTPANIANLVAALANPQSGESVYDPCFGSGNFLVAAWQQVERNLVEPRLPGPLLEVAGIEINSSTFLIGLTRVLLGGIESPRLEWDNSLESKLLSSSSRQGFDIVLANPPIGVKTSREYWHYQHFIIPTNDSTGLFVQHAMSQLSSHGRAVIVVPEGFLFRSGAERELRRYLLEQGQVEAVIGLPAGAFAPYTSIKASLLVLTKQKRVGPVRMADASTLFETRSGRKAPLIRAALAEQLAREVRGAELRKPRELPLGIPENTPGTGVLTRSVWEVSIEELEAADWDLSPRRREKGGLDKLLGSLKEALGESGEMVSLSDVAEVFSGRSIKSADLQDHPPVERAVGYVRIRDLSSGKVGRASSWLRPELVSFEQRWALLPGDILVSKSGTIGKSALVRNIAVGSIAANGLYVLRVNQKRIDANFLLAYLSSSACQNWLAAQSRGSVIQHLNRAVLNDLPVPLPPPQMQARAAAQFREFGTDTLTFLSQATGSSESDRLTAWLAELDSKVPRFTSSLDETPTLSHFEPVVALVGSIRNWIAHGQVSSHVTRWLMPLNQAVLPLAGVSQIPQGPGLLNVLQDAERGMQSVLVQTTGHLPAESQARAIAERLSDWLRAAITDLTDIVGLQIRTSPPSLIAGSFAEFSVELENQGALPLRNLRLKTQPEWGIATIPYLAERSTFTVSLRGDVPKQSSDLSLHLQWQANALSGQVVDGVIELAIRVTGPDDVASTLAAELGGSPYVTGSPLEPKHGHGVFYGREELLEKISRQVASHGNVVLLEGNRRAGKTSILKHLEGQSAVPGWLAVYSSLQGAEGASQVVGVPTAEVFREIARSIATALTKLGIDVPLPNGQMLSAGKTALGIARACREGISIESPFADFREYLELVLAALAPLDLGLLLMLDEFDKLQEGIDNGVTSPQVPENIRFLIQTYPKFSAILTGSRRLKRLREEYWSALYGLGMSIPVTVLDAESARKVVIEPVRDQLAFSHEAVERVIEVTARHPYLMQCLCNRIFDYAVQTKNRSITASVVNDAALGLVRDNEHFASMWDYAGAGPQNGRHRRHLILMLCAVSFKHGIHIGFGPLNEQLAQVGVDINDEALDADLAYLRELELIEFSGEIGEGQYHLAIPLMADWIEQQQDSDVVASRARTEAEEENA
ncbi:hypothetical protein C4K22_2559 [Pseudomonas chlororaphis subsp. aurantiaca]|nr:hypothetical protein C4K22_2559 [Pseudomonas chlororaphis subsp. aurantiaca]AZD41635.1 Type I restriction-modification system, DNA-methyltransferase subunit M [Pseudomonas chlororaphis subsp. aurantiaca]AZD66324.1 hypothetical protein C4K17_2438 [Pseudomonas chlororaphis subsp. aurantiaca]SDT34776.1 type I restriction enzyme M protein [Pseudomonas chlororaphis]